MGTEAKRGIGRATLRLALLASTNILVTAPALALEPGTSADDPVDPPMELAATEAPGGEPETGDIVVTAQKRSESIQRVPISVQALGNETLENRQVEKFEDYAKLLPSVSFQSEGPGKTDIYFRGIALGVGPGGAGGSLPSTGLYLDEQSITTITGALDVHIYDVERLEALAGPQGTLFGASSQSGVLRIITNKPDASAFSGGFNLQANTVAHGDPGYLAEGFINQPISDNAAIRIVAFYQKNGGYIDNVPATRDYTTAGLTLNNDELVEEDFNPAQVWGGRATLKVDLDDNWTVTPSVVAQKSQTYGINAFNPIVGDLETTRFQEDSTRDRWLQTSLTIEGKIGDFDVTYAGGFMTRKFDEQLDYSDYSFFYDNLYGYYFLDDAGNLINPNEHSLTKLTQTKQSHELRLATPTDWRLRATVGLFYQKQYNFSDTEFFIEDNAVDASVTGRPGTYFLIAQRRIDRDYAAFGEATFDITDRLSLAAGGRVFKYRNTVDGFFGFRFNEPDCSRPGGADDRIPCYNVDGISEKWDTTYRLNLSWEIDDDRLLYGTISTGYRPGGINRRAGLGGYAQDEVKNYEVGFKSSWLDRRMRFNIALYQLDWSDIQFSFQGLNGISDTLNAGDARVRGVEADFFLNPLRGLTLNAAAAYTDAKLTRDYCRFANASFDCTIPSATGQANSVRAPAGTRLPITPDFKISGSSRYEFPVGGATGHVQGTVSYQTSAPSQLRPDQAAIIGDIPAYTLADFSAGVAFDTWSIEAFVRNAFDERAQLSRYSACTPGVCGVRPYAIPAQPRLIGINLSRKL